MKTIISVILYLAAIAALSVMPEHVASAQIQTRELQVLSPNAQELGKYGRVPVNYFNGLPEISVPLTELKARGYTLPVYLTYHASGHKPDQHPGWTGLGWSLHAGGSITRIIRGEKDEMKRDEYGHDYGTVPSVDPGYLFHAATVQGSSSLSSSEGLYGLAMQNNGMVMDLEPDEFIVNVPGIQASFYITGDRQVRIVSKGDVSFDVDWELGNDSDISTGLMVYPKEGALYGGLRACRYSFFLWFKIRDREGNVYYFGGGDDSIEYSIRQDPQMLSPNSSVGSGTWSGRAVANTWMLTRIERADGEVIDFSYKSDGVPIVLHDFHFDEISGGVTDGGYRLPTIRSSSFTNPAQKLNLSFSFLRPLYLCSIRSRLSGEALTFGTERTTELGYSFSIDDFERRVGYFVGSSPGMAYSEFLDENYYLQLSSITGSDCDISFDYSANQMQRLRLNGVNFHAPLSGAVDHSYNFTYDPMMLPAYNSRLTDAWGFYSGNAYTPSEDMTVQSRPASPASMKAEILTSIQYPTGGSTSFEYEPHYYSKVACQFPFRVENLDSVCVAGGLRVRTITDVSGDGMPQVRTISYIEGNTSSGILSGRQRFSVSVSEHVDSPSPLPGFHVLWYRFGELPLNQLSDTDGNHVTYSRVIETLPDGSSSTYVYSNHDNDPNAMDAAPFTGLSDDGNAMLVLSRFSSGELFRGLLLSREDRDSEGNVVHVEVNTYDNHHVDYIKSVSKAVFGTAVGLASFSKIYCGYPHIMTKSVSDIMDDGTSVSSTTTYQYNSERRLVSESTWSGGMISGRMVFYPSDRTGETYAGMLAAGMSGVPVGEATLRNGKIVSAREMTYRPVPVTVCDTTLTKYLPDRIYTSSFSSPLEPSAYNASPMSYMASVPQMEFLRYDASGNPVEVIADGISSEYGWDGQSNPSFISSGMRNAVTTVGDVYQREDIALNYRTSTQTIRREFTTTGPSRNVWVSVSMQQGYGWLFYVAMDGVEVGRIVTYGSYWEPTGQWLGYLESYEGSVSVNVPAGDHVISITRLDSWKETSYPDSGAGTLMIHYYSSQTLQTGTDDVAFMFDFEEDASSAEGGFFSGKAHVGLFRPGVTVPSDRRYLVDYRICDGGEWKFAQAQYTGPTMSVGAAGKKIDHVRVFPEDGGMTSYTWYPGHLLRSETDSRGVTVSYDYDTLGRLTRIRDNDGEPVAGYDYRYSTHSDAADTLNTVSEYVYLSPEEASSRTSVTVFDGLGREVRNVLRNGGAPGWDIVTRSDYDLNGRPWKTWLPVAVNVDGVHAQSGILDGRASDIYGPGEVTYSENVYEPSPLDRVRTEIGPGSAWRNPVRGVSHGTFTNVTDASSPYHYSGYSVSWNRDAVSVSRSSTFSPGTMAISSTTDEDGRVTLEFMNPIGETVLVRQMADSTGSVRYDTHYVYDSMGRLSAVIPPSLSERMLSSVRSYWYESDISDLAYVYRYDSRGNCIAKLIPGGGWNYYVYDRNNRPVLSQDAVQRQSDEWSFSIADRQGRPVLTGTAQMSLNPFADPLRNTDVYAVLPLSPSYDNPFKGYVLNGMSIQSPTLLNVNFYDFRGFAGCVESHPDISTSDLPDGLSSMVYTLSDCGMLTGSLTGTLGEDGVQYLYSVPYYDARGQVVKSASSTHLGGEVIVLNRYDFEGLLLWSRLSHSPASGSSMPSLDQDYAYTYDTMGRPLTATLKISGQNTPSSLYSNNYDLIGRLVSDGKGTSYSYNVRSWLTSIAGQGFSESLCYWDGLTPQYGGNVSSMVWSTGNGGLSRRYDYSYDGLSRLVNARYSENGVTTQRRRFFEETYSYDLNGNMTSLVRYGLTPIPDYRGVRLNLAMEYSGNQLSTVRKSSGAESSFSYDAKGRQISTTYGGNASMTYNAIDLPSTFVKGGTSIRWMYGTDGTKLQVRTAKAQ